MDANEQGKGWRPTGGVEWGRVMHMSRYSWVSIGRKTERQKDRKTERQKDRQTDIQTDGQTDIVSYRGASLKKSESILCIIWGFTYRSIPQTDRRNKGYLYLSFIR